MLPSELLRMPDLARVGIRNWPTLKRRVQNDGFPPGRYVGHSRVWTVEEVSAWWESRPTDPPNVRPAAASPGREDGSERETEVSLHTPSLSDSVEPTQALPNGKGA
jgi:predicted DNA-binding transcriptional regulator AlpA